jgi:hypothetical protein
MSQSEGNSEFERAMRDLGESEGKRIYDQAFASARKEGISEKGAKNYAEDVVINQADWVMR